MSDRLLLGLYFASLQIPFFGTLILCPVNLGPLCKKSIDQMYVNLTISRNNMLQSLPLSTILH